MTDIDSEYVNRAAPPASMRYFALMYAPSAERELLTALFIVEAEIRASITQAAHEVAHARLQWWRAEIDRLVNRNSQHPATRVLQTTELHADFSALHELVVAADMDLARMTYQTRAELNAYLERSGGVSEIFARTSHASPAGMRELGGLIRRTETLRDLAMDARVGRIYWPLDELQRQGVTPERLQAREASEELRQLVAGEVTAIRAKLDAAIASITDPRLRPIAVLARLHAKLLRHIERANYNVFTERHELGPFEKVWTAWRAARQV